MSIYFRHYLCLYLLVLLWVFLVSGCGSVETTFQKCQDDGNCGPTLDVKLGIVPSSPIDPAWTTVATPQVTVELGPQLITNPQWPNPAIKKVSLVALRSDSEIGILLSWEDNSNELAASYSDDYTDKAAIMFPLEFKNDIPPITMGAEGSPVNIWQWKANLEAPMKKNLFPGSTPLSNTFKQDNRVAKSQRKSPVEDLNAEGFSTLTYQTKQNVLGRGIWGNNKWLVLFKRTLKNSDPSDIQFTSSTPMAIAVWNGANKERNGQKGISKWILLKFS